MRHTKEPWSCNEFGYIYAGNPQFIVGHISQDAESNARRIVACVNACAGLPIDKLDVLVGSSINELKQQNAELVEALESALESRLDIDYSRDGSIYTMLSKAKILELFNILSKHKEVT